MTPLKARHMYRVGPEIASVFTDGKSFLVGLFKGSGTYHTLKQAYNDGRDCKVFKTADETVEHLFNKYHPQYSK